MKLRYWSLVPATGEVLGELLMTGPVAFSHRYGGGAFSGAVKLDFPLANGDPDWGWAQEMERRTRPWSRSIVVTSDKKVVLGEWIITKRASSTHTPEFGLTGVQWEEFPQFQSLRSKFERKSQPQISIARDLLALAFEGVPITLPAMGPVSVTRTVEWAGFSCYIGDALDELADGKGGFEWCVDITGVWSGDRLTGVQRSLAYQEPTLKRGEVPLDVIVAAPRTRYGSAVITGLEDGTDWATDIIGLGAGSGTKQVGTAWTYSPSGSAWSYPPGEALPSSRHVLQPAARTPELLLGMVQEAGDRAKAMRRSWQVQARIDDLQYLPRLGYQARLDVPRTWGFPSGFTRTLRIGEVAYQADAHSVEVVTMQTA